MNHINKVLITGVAGFIGFHLALKFLKRGVEIVGIDNMNDYYDINLKEDRLRILKKSSKFYFFKSDLNDENSLKRIFSLFKFDVVINLAAQAGVRYSIKNPRSYINSNIIGFFNILEACRYAEVSHLIFASSSSVYGNQEKIPFSIDDIVDRPISLYAATKKSNELMAYSYAHLYGIPITGLRFFTVYGPYGRPDMAYFSFANKIMRGEPIKIFNFGNMLRDFTYIDDVIEGIENIVLYSTLKRSSNLYYKIYNIGNKKPIKLDYFVELLERYLGKKALKEYLPMQDGDAYQTFADIKEMENDYRFLPKTNIEAGIEKFSNWYKSYYGISH